METQKGLSTEEEQLVELGLQAFRKLFSKAWQSRSIGLVLTRPDGLLVRCNPKAALILSGKKEELSTGHLQDYLLDPEQKLPLLLGHPDLDKINRSHHFHSRLFPNETIRVIAEAPVETPEGLLTLLLLQDITDEATYVQDLSAQKILEQSLQQANIELKQSNADKDRFLYIIAHDLRSPLNNLMALLDLLRKNYPGGREEDIQQMLQLLSSNAHAMYELIENLLNWSVSQSGRLSCRPQALNLSLMLRKVLGQLESSAAGKDIQIELKVQEGTFVYADEAMLTTVLRNLLSNAIKFSHLHQKVEVKLSELPGQACLQVKDYGVGIRPEILHRLFKSDKQPSTPGTMGETGTGFGLHLCYDMAQLMGGSIRVESTPNQGSTFYLLLPALPEA